MTHKSHTNSALVLVINTGSSSIKIALLHMPSEHIVMEALLENMEEDSAILHWYACEKEEHRPFVYSLQESIEKMLNLLFQQFDKSQLIAVGHRVVHGGERFIKPIRLNNAIIQELENISHLAPLHNPANILGIQAAMSSLPDIHHVAIFDTAFHHAMPNYASLYATPYHWYKDYGVRRYGFHGTSHAYVGQKAAIRLEKSFADCQLLTAHLGNGCSATAIVNGVSMDTSMGLTPLDGLMMGTRSGHVDPGLHSFIKKMTGKSLSSITHILNKKSGLLGLSERSHDMRILLQASKNGDAQSTLAIDVYCYQLAKTLAGLCVALDTIDAIVFTGGVGEHAAVIRQKTMNHLMIFNIQLDAQRNQANGSYSNGFITSKGANIPVMVIATHEEKMIARDVMSLEDN